MVIPDHAAFLVFLAAPAGTRVVPANRFPDVAVRVGGRWSLVFVMVNGHLTRHLLSLESFRQAFESALAVGKEVFVGTTQIIVPVSIPVVLAPASTDELPLTLLTMGMALALPPVEGLRL